MSQSKQSAEAVGDTRRLRDIDVNLLVVLGALLEECSVTRAANRLNRTQSAVSHALGRLRQLFDDPLLVRTPTGMQPTPRALELVVQLREALNLLERVVQPPRRFDPNSAEGTLRLGALDYFASVLLPDYVAAVATEAPGIRVEIIPTADDAAAQLITGELDLALGVFGKLPPTLYRQKLFDDPVVCMVREGHPEVQGTLSLEKYITLNHAMISTGSSTRSNIDHALEARGLCRRVVLRLPHFLAAPKIIAKTDYVITLPSRLAKQVAESTPVQVLPLPLDLDSSVFYQAWHERSHELPAHRWLRELMAKLAREATAPIHPRSASPV